MIVWPDAASLRMSRQISNADWPSSPDVGSSRNSSDGFATSSVARVSLFRCSIERPEPGAVWNYVSKSSSGNLAESPLTANDSMLELREFEQIHNLMHIIDFVLISSIETLTKPGREQ